MHNRAISCDWEITLSVSQSQCVVAHIKRVAERSINSVPVIALFAYTIRIYFEYTNGGERRDVLRFFSLASLLLMAIAMAGLVIRGVFFSTQPLVILAEVTAAALMVWARLIFGRRSFHAAANPTAGRLVTTGPYRYIRHPIYTAICLFAWSGILAHWSLINILLGVLLLAGAIGRMLAEEQMLASIYPEYREYARVTKRMAPYIF